MDKWVGVALAGVGAEVFAFAGTTMFAAALCVPFVLTALIPHIAGITRKSLSDAVLAVGQLGAVERAAAHLGGELGTGDAKELFGHDMVNTLLQPGDLFFETHQQPFGNLTQEYATLAARVEKSRLWVAEQLLRQQIEHPVGEFRRGENLVTAQIGQAV